MDEIIEYLKKKYDLEDEDIRCISRLLKKNLVFEVEKDGKKFAIKVYAAGEDPKGRFQKETGLYNYFQDKKILKVPKKKESFSPEGFLLITDWIEGESIKNKIKHSSLEEYLPDVERMIEDINKVHRIPPVHLPFLEKEKVGIDQRLKKPYPEIQKEILESKDIDIELFAIYEDLRSKVKPHLDYVINSDISAHEYYLPEGVWIDFERFSIGDPNNDYARCFMSLTNGIIDRENEIETIYRLFQKTPYYEQTTFLYYLIEKLLCSIHDAPDQISDEEIHFFQNFIKNQLEKKKEYKKEV